MTYGLPLGSILGSLLNILYTADLNLVVSIWELQLTNVLMITQVYVHGPAVEGGEMLWTSEA